MNKVQISVDSYLEEVRKYLAPLADKDSIIKELRTHIWDLANKISEDEGVGIQEAFIKAIEQMEDPEVLAAKFLDEDPQTFKSKSLIPEIQIKDEQIIILVIVGFAFVSLFSALLQFTLENPIFFGFAWISGFLALGLFILVLYFKDEKSFQEQVDKLREAFLKPSEPKKHAFKSEDEKEVGFWSAFGEHLGGLIGGFFIGLLIFFLFVNDVTNMIPLYNANWHFIGGLVVYISLFAGLLKAVWFVAFGKIRASRLISAGENIITGLAAVILIVYYPFTVGEALNVLVLNPLPVGTLEEPVLTFLSNIDDFIRIVIGLGGIINFIEALYDVFKFGAWKPSDRRSLI